MQDLTDNVRYVPMRYGDEFALFLDAGEYNEHDWLMLVKNFVQENLPKYKCYIENFTTDQSPSYSLIIDCKDYQIDISKQENEFDYFLVRARTKKTHTECLFTCRVLTFDLDGISHDSGFLRIDGFWRIKKDFVIRSGRFNLPYNLVV